MVYFVSSIDATSTGETIRRTTRQALTRKASTATVGVLPHPRRGRVPPDLAEMMRTLIV